MSMLRRNMTHAPTTNRSLASKPAVMLQLLFSFASFSAVFLFVPFTRITCFVDFVCTWQLMYFRGQTTEHVTVEVIARFSSGEKTDRWLSMFPKLNEFVCNAPLNEPLLKGANSFSSWTATVYGIQQHWPEHQQWTSCIWKDHSKVTTAQTRVCNVCQHLERHCLTWQAHHQQASKERCQSFSNVSIATLCSKERVSAGLVFMSNSSLMAALASPISCGSSSSLLILCSSPSACLGSLIFLMLAWGCNIFCNLQW